MQPIKIKSTGINAVAFLVLGFIASLTACDDPNPPVKTQADIVTELLISGGSPWSPTMITVDGVDVTSDLFAGFSLSFAENTLTTTGTSPVWLEQDTWHFKDETATIIIRGQDSKEIAIKEVSETQLVLTLDWEQTTTVPEGGRKASLKGKHEFILNK